MGEPKTEPGFQLPRASKRPWWVALIVGGVSTGAGLAGSMWLASAPARGSEPRLATAGISTGATAAEHQQAEEAAWRGRMEGKLDDALQRISHIEGRLDRR